MSFIAGLTAFYMFRLYYNIFWGTPSQYAHTPHEAPRSMTIPLMILAAITLFAGFIPFGHFVSSDGLVYHIHLDWSVAFYKSKCDIPDRLQHMYAHFYKAAYHRFYIDEFYLFITKRIIFNGVSRPIAWFDRHVVDGFFNFIAWGTHATSDEIRGLQSGRVQQYAYVFLLGALILILILIL